MKDIIQTVDFHDQTLITLEKDNQHYVAMKPICENIGLNWEAQRQRISRDEVLNSVACMIKATGTDSKIYKMLCLPLQYLNGWLFGVDTNRVKAEIKDKLITYKKECYQALFDYWNKGVAVNPRRITISVEQQQAIRNTVAKICKDNRTHYQTVYEALKKEFDIPRYNELLESDFERAMAFIENFELPSAEIAQKPFDIYEYLNTKSNQIMYYVHDLERAIFELTGNYPKRPYKPDEIAKGVIGHCLNGQRVELSFQADCRHADLRFSLVDNSTIRIHDSNIAKHIEYGNVSKKYLDDIIQASVKRLKK